MEEDELIDRGDIVDDEDDIEEDTDIEEEVEEEIEDPKEDLRYTELLKQLSEREERNLWLEDQVSKLVAHSTSKIEKEEVKVTPRQAYDYAASEEAYGNLMIEGEVAKAAKLRVEIDSARMADIMDTINGVKESVSKQAKEESTALIEAERFSKVVETLEDKYPFLNPEDKAYNEEAVDTVNSLINGFMAKGASRTEALKQSVARVVKLYQKEDDKASIGNTRTVSAGKKAADASRRQPPEGKSVSTKELAPKPISKMSEKEFNALTSQELKALRGD